MTKILSPFRYCEQIDENRGNCFALAGMVVHGMSFCEWHGKRLIDLLEVQGEGIELIYEEVKDVSNRKK